MVAAFCLEVFEHLPEAESVKAIAEIHRLLKPDGVAVIGVPHELFLPAVLKGLFRMFRRYEDFDARPSNILSAFRGRPPSQRPIAEISPGCSYHFHHLGFDYRALDRLLQEQFRLAEKWFSPFPILGAVLNSEVYFLLRKAQQIRIGRAQPRPYPRLDKPGPKLSAWGKIDADVRVSTCCRGDGFSQAERDPDPADRCERDDHRWW